MTKKQIKALQSAVYDLDRFLAWVARPDVEICKVGAPPGIAYCNQAGRELGPLCKSAGSPLQFVENSRDRIRSLCADS